MFWPTVKRKSEIDIAFERELADVRLAIVRVTERLYKAGVYRKENGARTMQEIMTDIYARVKLHVICALTQECVEWTSDHYDVDEDIGKERVQSLSESPQVAVKNDKEQSSKG